MIDSDKIPFVAVANQIRDDLYQIETEVWPKSLAIFAAIDLVRASVFDYEQQLRDSPVPVNKETRDAAQRCHDSLMHLIELLEVEQ